MGDPCAGALGRLEQTTLSRRPRALGSHDENSEEVDNGDFEVVDDDTVSFPSHATESGYDGDLVVDYAVDGDVAAFAVVVPEPCVDECADAYAWALRVRVWSVATWAKYPRERRHTCALLRIVATWPRPDLGDFQLAT